MEKAPRTRESPGGAEPPKEPPEKPRSPPPPKTEDMVFWPCRGPGWEAERRQAAFTAACLAGGYPPPGFGPGDDDGEGAPNTQPPRVALRFRLLGHPPPAGFPGRE